MNDNKALLIIFAVSFPPLAAYFASEGNDKQMFRTIAALVGTFVFFIPGVVYALDIVLDWKAVYPKLDKMSQKQS